MHANVKQKSGNFQKVALVPTMIYQKFRMDETSDAVQSFRVGKTSQPSCRNKLDARGPRLSKSKSGFFSGAEAWRPAGPDLGREMML